jgi:acetolactate synthase I/II/III large subunit
LYTTSSAVLEALYEAGVDCLFTNYGSDHTGVIEAVAAAREQRRPIPRVVTAPAEMVALSAAHGHAQLSGRAQAVLVHVECGTQSLAGAIHNASKGRVPVLILAGTSPATQEGEIRGSRNEFIQWIQDVADQRGIVRGYVNYDHEIRFGANAKQIVHRALQIAQSDPRGPVYLMASREVLEAETARVEIRMDHWRAVAPAALPAEAAAGIARSLLEARRPLVVTSFVGRNPAAVAELERLSGELAVGVLESVPSYVNYPTTDALYLGCQWNEQRQNAALAEADFIVVVDSDVPWIPSVSRPRPEARIVHIDPDPLKTRMPLWYIPAEAFYRADAATALAQILEAAHQLPRGDSGSGIAERRAHFGRQHERLERALNDDERPRADRITPEHLTAAVREAVGDEAVVMSEAVTNFHVVTRHMRRRCPGTLFSSGGGSLGWCGGAAVGAKLARPDALVVALNGDGSYLFSQPATVHWMARRYSAPFLQVIYNNGGWRAPRVGALGMHPDGAASRAAALDTDFAPDPDYAGIAAAAGGAYARTISRPEEVVPALQAALEAVRVERRCAVIDARIAQP